jgi:Putative prokaryotic signal transducing protein
MAAEAEMVTVFRSADDDAEEDAKAVRELLTAQGIDAVLLDDSAPGVPAGAWEVQVPAAGSARAEHLIGEARLPDQDLTEVDNSSALDVETIFHAHGGSHAELEAMSVKGMLEAAGIAAILVGDSVLPNLSFEVQVAREHAEQARQVIAEAQRIGSQAADEEELAGEAPLNP